MQYYDRNGRQIQAGMYLRFEDGSVEKVYTCSDSGYSDGLGINASNEAYLRINGLEEMYREYYPLSNFDLRKVSICEQTEAESPEQQTGQVVQQ